MKNFTYTKLIIFAAITQVISYLAVYIQAPLSPLFDFTALLEVYVMAAMIVFPLYIFAPLWLWPREDPTDKKGWFITLPSFICIVDSILLVIAAIFAF